MNKQKNTRKYGSFWVCPNCEGNPEFEHKDMMEHFKDAHAIDPSKTKGKKSMLFHMDGDIWYSWSYEWTINDLKFIQNTCNKRSGSNLSMWQ